MSSLLNKSFGPAPIEGIEAYPKAGSVDPDVFEKPLHIAIGMFDGVHLGHQAVIRQAMESAASEEGHLSAVLTFDPHPSRVIRPDLATSLLMPLPQRVRDMHAVGADYVFVQSFSKSYAEQDAEAFVPGLLDRFPGIKSIHVGENFRFGKGRSGNIATLKETALPLGIAVHALERKMLDGMAISSSRIRAAIIEGSIQEVNGMLGHPYTARGRVIPGKGVGRKLQFPTLNIGWCPEVRPRFGVYQVNLLRPESSERLPGVANYGIRPTIDDASDPVLEVHLLQENLIPGEGDQIQVELLEFLRPEKAFSSVEELRAQISLDVDGVRRRLTEGEDTGSIPG